MKHKILLIIACFALIYFSSRKEVLATHVPYSQPCLKYEHMKPRQDERTQTNIVHLNTFEKYPNEFEPDGCNQDVFVKQDKSNKIAYLIHFYYSQDENGREIAYLIIDDQPQVLVADTILQETNFYFSNSDYSLHLTKAGKIKYGEGSIKKGQEIPEGYYDYSEQKMKIFKKGKLVYVSTVIYTTSC